MEKEAGALHTYLCKKIIEKRKNELSPVNKLVIKRKDFRRMLGWFNIPFYIQCKVIDEMIAQGLIKVKDKQNIILTIPKKEDSDWFE